MMKKKEYLFLIILFQEGLDYDLDDLTKQCEGTECIVKERDQDKRVIFIYLIIIFLLETKI